MSPLRLTGNILFMVFIAMPVYFDIRDIRRNMKEQMPVSKMKIASLVFSSLIVVYFVVTTFDKWK
ncbi:MAG: hypothetical protein JNM41_09130 [Flavipsychrobacter sp.]|nr:hypothetical protein [Flavipsychrobacter sp.]